jgi:hypothetical protein
MKIYSFLSFSFVLASLAFNTCVRAEDFSSKTTNLMSVSMDNHKLSLNPDLDQKTTVKINSHTNQTDSISQSPAITSSSDTNTKKNLQKYQRGYIAPVMGIDTSSNTAFGIHGRITWAKSDLSNRITIFFPENKFVSTNVIAYDLGLSSTANIYFGPGVLQSSTQYNTYNFMLQIGAESEIVNNIILFADYNIVFSDKSNGSIFKFGLGYGL